MMASPAGGRGRPVVEGAGGVDAEGGVDFSSVPGGSMEQGGGVEGHEVQTTDGRKSNKARLIYHLCVKFIYYWGRAYRKTSRELSISIATAVKDMSSSSARATKGSSPVASIKEASAEAATGSVAAEPTGAPLTLAKTERRLFSAHHPMIPKRYVPAWQLDMKNRKLIIQVG